MTKIRIARVSTDKLLLAIFVVGAFLTTMSILIIPLNIEHTTIENHHGIENIAQTASSEGLGKSNRVTTRKGKLKGKAKDKNEKQKEEQGKVIDTNAEQQNLSKLEKTKYDGGKPAEQSAYHVVFSTGCSIFQDWQSYVFFFHVLKSGQQGHVTRIASGCKDDEAKDLRRVFKEEIEPMAPGRLHLHLTPEYGKIKPGLSFKYFNKPFGMRHWMENGLGYPDGHATHDDSIIILMDPDQILLRPFTNDFTNSSEIWRLREGRYKLKVEHGSPFAQQYGYGLQWKRKVDISHVFNDEPTPVSTMADKEAFDYYMAMGPPYVATAKDMYAIVSKWSEIVARVHDSYPFLLAEMFGYNLAIAHLGLRHTIAFSFMVSDVFAGEGWKLIDPIPGEDICHNFPKSEYPHVIHYCQRYVLGKWFFGKYRLRKDFISCEAPLLKVPPDDLALKYTTAMMPDGTFKQYNDKHSKEEAFMVCAMIDAMNDAAVYYKNNHCTKATANYDYSYTFFDDMEMPDDKM